VDAASKVGVALDRFEAGSADQLGAAFTAISKSSVNGLVLLGEPMYTARRQEIVALAASYKVPTTIYPFRLFTDAGGLMSYGPDVLNLWRRSAVYFDKIFKAIKPADLPVEQPTKFELVINLKTAKALGLTIPPSLLLRAD
jgi:putative ABC transport system substrate-binding protein